MDINSYENLVTYRNSLKQKYMEFVRLVLEHPVGLAAATDSFLYAFDLDNAVGVNLDTLGALVGMDRLLPFVPTVGSRELNDSEYRLMIRLKIARNVWDGRNETISDVYQRLFPELNIQYIDNQDMTITVKASGSFNFRTAELLAASGLVLVPAGVGYNVVTYGGGTEFRLYVGTGQHGELIIDRIEIRYRTWAEVLAAGMTWEDVKGMTWSELLSSSDISSESMTWGAMKDFRMTWGDVSRHTWQYYND